MSARKPKARPSKKPPIITVTFVKPGDVVAKPRRPPTRAEIGLRYDMSQFYSMKSVLEEALGHPAYVKLKETGTMTDWRAETSRLLAAIELAIKSTVVHTDAAWRADVAAVISLGQQGIKSSETISDLFSALSASLSRIVFMQIGHMPKHTLLAKRAPLTPEWWTLNTYRSVQYVQNDAQKLALVHRQSAALRSNKSHEA
jgi:hypothetical protein